MQLQYLHLTTYVWANIIVICLADELLFFIFACCKNRNCLQPHLCSILLLFGIYFVQYVSISSGNRSRYHAIMINTSSLLCKKNVIILEKQFHPTSIQCRLPNKSLKASSIKIKTTKFILKTTLNFLGAIWKHLCEI